MFLLGSAVRGASGARESRRRKLEGMMLQQNRSTKNSENRLTFCGWRLPGTSASMICHAD
jgi:hypothetical protein